jgi:hypothetical protein
MTSINSMPPNARLWVYQSNRALSEPEIKSIQSEGEIFVNEWSAHGAALRASFEILYDRFVVIAVDEKQAMASGCSIDKSVHFIKDLEKKYILNFFDRMQVAYKKGDKIEAVAFPEFEKLASNKSVDENTIVFNNMVASKTAFDTEWEVPLKKSWQSRVLK